MSILRLLSIVYADNLVVATLYPDTSEQYVPSLDVYTDPELWSCGLCEFHGYGSKNVLCNYDTISYGVANLYDIDLSTAWIPDGILNAELTINFDYPSNSVYADPWQFHGVISIFNGYCKSKKLWSSNSRVKEMKVYYNDSYVCNVRLLDTWKCQRVDIQRFFKNRRDKKFLDARYEIKSGDVLRFVVTDVYYGDKYSDIAISEFLFENGGN